MGERRLFRLLFHSGVPFDKEMTSQAFKSPALWKCPLMNIFPLSVCARVFFSFPRFFSFYFVLSQYVNTMAIGDKLDEKGGFCLTHGSGNVLLIQSGHKQLWWGSWSYSRIVFFSFFCSFCFFFLHIVMFIFLFKSKILFFRATGVQCKNLRCIVSYCLWVKRKYKRIKTSNLKQMPAGKKKATGSASTS